MNADNPEDAICSYIGEGCVLKGRIEVSDSIVVDGVVEGDLVARSITIGPTGRIDGHIMTAEADIRGAVTSSLEVKQLLAIRPTGRINGSVHYGELLLEKGAIINGDFVSTDFRFENNVERNEFQKIEMLRVSDKTAPRVSPKTGG